MKRTSLSWVASVLILSAVCFAQKPSTSTGKQPLTIESIFAEGGLTGRGPENVQWAPDNSRFSFIQRDDSGEHGQLWYVDASTGEKKVLVSEVKLNALAPPTDKIKDEREKERVSRYRVGAYHWAPDSKHLLFDSQGQLWMFDLNNGAGVQFTSSPDPVRDPKFSSDGGRVAYVRNHNLFIRPVSGKFEKQLTKDKDPNILNGEVDWVYSEELSVRSNYFWSPDDRQIAYLQMNETQVPAYPITDWMPVNASVDHEKYPKPGDPNPAVKLGVVSAAGGKTRWITLPQEAEYVPRFGWLRNGILWAQVLNRTQDRMELYFIDARSGRSQKALTEEAKDAWVNVTDDFHVLKTSPNFTWSSWRDGHTQLYLYSFNQSDPLADEAKLERQLTKGDFEVLKLDGVDEKAGTVFFTSNQGDPRQQQLYSVKLQGGEMTKLSRTEGVHESTFSDDARSYVDSASTAMTPTVVSACTVEANCKPVWSSKSLESFDLIPPKFLEFKADDGTRLYGELLLPAAGTAGDRIPLIVHVYGGPAAQLVTDQWGGQTFLFHQMLVARGFAVFTVDNRGTPNRDRKFQTAIRHQFGAVELKDQISALNQLLTQVPQLDRTRIAIWGWSNGGSMTLYSLTHSQAFKAGVAVAPVTDWHLYDSIYTERYMGLLKENPKGYDDSLPKAADKLHGSLLLVHGTSDDNVHMQNSIQMIEGLIKAGKQFKFMPYPNKTHGIGGTADRTHLFHMIQNHFQSELMNSSATQRSEAGADAQ